MSNVFTGNISDLVTEEEYQANKPTIGKELKKGIGRGIDLLQANAYGALAAHADAAKANTVRDWAEQGQQSNMQEAAQNPAAEPSFTGLGKAYTDGGIANGIGRTGLWAAGAVGELAPQGAAAMASGAIGKRLGGGAGSAGLMMANNVAQETGSIYGDILEKTGKREGATAIEYGIPAALIDTAVEAVPVGKVLGSGLGSGSVIKDAAKAGVKQLVTEAPKEAIQTGIERAAVTSVDPDQQTFTPEGWREIIDSAAAGGIGGAVSGAGAEGIGRGLQTLTQNRQEQGVAGGQQEEVLPVAPQAFNPSPQIQTDPIARHVDNQVQAAASVDPSGGPLSKAVSTGVETGAVAIEAVKQAASDPAIQAKNLLEIQNEIQANQEAQQAIETGQALLDAKEQLPAGDRAEGPATQAADSSNESRNVFGLSPADQESILRREAKKLARVRAAYSDPATLAMAQNAKTETARLSDQENKDAELNKVRAKVDGRLNLPEFQDQLVRMADNAGWEEVGGRVIMRDLEGNGRMTAVGRTPWAPKKEWFVGGLGNKEQIQTAVRKAINGEKLGDKQRQIVEYMLDFAGENIITTAQRNYEYDQFFEKHDINGHGNMTSAEMDEFFSSPEFMQPMSVLSSVGLPEEGKALNPEQEALIEFAQDHARDPDVADAIAVFASSASQLSGMDGSPDTISKAFEAIAGGNSERQQQNQSISTTAQGESTGGTRGGVEGGQEAQGAGILQSYTNEEIAAKEKAAADAASKASQDAAKAEQKARADAGRGDFQLTGSDRPADVAAAAGQNDIFGVGSASRKPGARADLFQLDPSKNRDIVEKWKPIRDEIAGLVARYHALGGVHSKDSKARIPVQRKAETLLDGLTGAIEQGKDMAEMPEFDAAVKFVSNLRSAVEKAEETKAKSDALKPELERKAAEKHERMKKDGSFAKDITLEDALKNMDPIGVSYARELGIDFEKAIVDDINAIRAFMRSNDIYDNTEKHRMQPGSKESKKLQEMISETDWTIYFSDLAKIKSQDGRTNMAQSMGRVADFERNRFGSERGWDEFNKARSENPEGKFSKKNVLADAKAKRALETIKGVLGHQEMDDEAANQALVDAVKDSVNTGDATDPDVSDVSAETYKAWKKAGGHLGKVNGWDLFRDDVRNNYSLMTPFSHVSAFSTEESARSWAADNKAKPLGYFKKVEAETPKEQPKEQSKSLESLDSPEAVEPSKDLSNSSNSEEQKTKELSKDEQKAKDWAMSLIDKLKGNDPILVDGNSKTWKLSMDIPAWLRGANVKSLWASADVSMGQNETKLGWTLVNTDTEYKGLVIGTSSLKGNSRITVQYTEIAEAQKDAKPEAKESNGSDFDPAAFTKTAADSIEKLRPQDVDRVLADAYSLGEDQLGSVTQYIMDNNAKLMPQVTEFFEKVSGFLEDTKDNRIKHFVEIGLRRRNASDLRESIAKTYGDDLAGLQLQGASDRYAFFLPDASNAGKFRVTYFDKNGLSGHTTYDTYVKALDEAIKDGYKTEAPGSLEKLSELDSFKAGNEWAHKLQAFHDGKITWADFVAGKEVGDSQGDQKEKPADSQDDNVKTQEKDQYGVSDERELSDYIASDYRNASNSTAIAGTGWVMHDDSINSAGTIQLVSASRNVIRDIKYDPKSGTDHRRAIVKATVWAQENPDKFEAPKGELVSKPVFTANRNEFTVERFDRDANENKTESFERGEYVRAMISKDKSVFGEIDGISQARNEASVDGLWYGFGSIYKAERPAKPEENKVPLGDVIDSVNKKHGEGLTDDDKVKAPSKTPSVDRHNEVIGAVNAGKATPEEFKASFNAVVDNADAIKAELATKTKAELLSSGGGFIRSRYASETKPRIIDAIYRKMLGDYVLGSSLTYGMGKGAYEAAVRQQVEATDADSLAAYAAELVKRNEESDAKRASIMAGIEDPKTLEDFRNIVRSHMANGKKFTEARLMMTPEQRAEYDRLEAETTRESRLARKRAAKTQVKAAGQTVGGEIIATKHTKKGHDLYAVQLAERVSKDDYTTLNAAAKRLGGYYSSFRANGAIPGFQFTDKANAEAFLQLAAGDTSAAKEAAEQRRDAFDDDRSQSAAERLNEMADRLEGRADEVLNADRKTNTHRRAAMAARAEGAANADKALASTMRNLAKAIEEGKAEFLDAVRQKTQIEMLEAMVKRAKDNEIRAKYPNYGDQQKHAGEKPSGETADHAEFPAFTAYRSDLASLARKMLEVEGTKKIGKQLMSVADDVSDAYIKFAKDNLDRVSQFGRGDKLADFGSREDAEKAIKRSNLVGKAIVLPVKRGQNRIVLSPSEAINREIWTGDGDKRITLSKDFGMEMVQAIGRRGSRANGLTVPWQLETAADRLKALDRIGIETPAEFRSALREFIALRQQAAEPDKIKEMERAMIGRRNDGLDFFPTPESVADEMVQAADIQPGMTVLEPSAGMGHIAERIKAAGVDPDVIEMSGDRKELLEAKGFNVIARDFMEIKPREFFTYGDVFKNKDGVLGVMRGSGGMGSNRVGFDPLDADGEPDMRRSMWENRDDLEGVRHRGLQSGYDRIIMNPPFSDRRDAEHVQHAYELLRPGGRIVAIMGEGVFYGRDKKAQAFRDWLESVGGTDEKLPDGTFLDPSLPVNTGVNARMVVIDKPESGSATQELDVPVSNTLSTEQIKELNEALKNVNDMQGKIAGARSSIIGNGEYQHVSRARATTRSARDSQNAEMLDSYKNILRSEVRSLLSRGYDVPEKYIAPIKSKVDYNEDGNYDPINKAPESLGGMQRIDGQTETPAFKRWFGNSVVVDSNGDPLVVYHGSPDARFINEDGIFKGLSERYGMASSTGGAFWFAASKQTAKSYADDRRAFDYQNAEAGVVPAYIKLENPLVINGLGLHWRQAQKRGKTSDVIEEAKAKGHDGVIIQNVKDDYNSHAGTAATDTYVVFSSTQIKSSEINNGNFDPENRDIRQRRVEPVMGGKTITREKAQEIVDRFVGQYKGAASLGFTLYDTKQHAYGTEALKRNKLENAILKGAYHKGKIHLILADHKDEADLLDTIRHEAWAHFGFDLVNPARKAEILKSVKADIESNGSLVAIMDQVKRNYRAEDGSLPSEAQLLEEVVARIAEKYGNQIEDQTMESGLRAAIRRIFETIMDSLRAVGLARYIRKDDGIKMAVQFLTGSARKQRSEINSRYDNSKVSLASQKGDGIDVGTRQIGFDITPEMRDAVESGLPLFRRDDATKAAYEKRIDELFAGEPAGRGDTVVLDEADVLSVLGQSNKPLVLKENKVHASLDNHPKMTAEQWKKIPEWLDSPVAVFASDTKPGDFVFIPDEMVGGNVVFITINPDSSVMNLDVHVMTNAYDRKDYQRTPFHRWMQQGKLLYVDLQKSPAFNDTSGLQLPRVYRQARGLNKTIKTDTDLVNYRKARDKQNPPESLDGAMHRMGESTVLAEGSPLYKTRTAEQAGAVSKAKANEALKIDATAQKILAKGNKINDGDLVGVRLNINVLNRTGVPVQSIHKGGEGIRKKMDKPGNQSGFYNGEVLTYLPVATLKNAYFTVHQPMREKIASGSSSKTPMASADGEWINTDSPSFDGVIARFNPHGEHLFIDQKGRAVKWAEEATITGHRAYLRGKIEYYKPGEAPEKAGDSATNATFYDPQQPPEQLDDLFFRRVSEGDASAVDVLKTHIQDRLQPSLNTFNWWHKSVGTQFHKAWKDRDYKKVFDKAQNYLNDTSRFAMESADLAPGLLPKVDSFADIMNSTGASRADIEKIADSIYTGTLDDQKVYTNQELSEKFGLNDRQRALYREFRKAINHSLDSMVASEIAKEIKDDPDLHGLVMMAKYRPERALDQVVDVLDARAEELESIVKQMEDGKAPAAEVKPYKIAATEARKTLQSVRDKLERLAKMKNDGYAPLMRFGKYTVTVTNNLGEIEYFGMFEKQSDARAMERSMSEEYGIDAQVSVGVMSQEAYKLYAGMSPDTLELFGSSIGFDKSQSDIFQDYLRMSRNNRSALKRLIRRKGTAGFSKDVTRSLASFITSNARQASGNWHLGEMDETIEQIRLNKKEKGDVIDEAIRLRDYLRNPKDEAASIRNLLFINYIGGSLASALTNMTQPITMTGPYLAQFGSATKHLLAAQKIGFGSKAEGDLGRAMERATDEGTLAPHEVYQLHSEAIRNLGSNILVRKFITAWGRPFALAEAYNRRLTFAAAYNMAKENPVILKQARAASPYSFAVKAVQETQGIYNKGNRPNWARGSLGATVFTFKQYSISYLEFLQRLPRKQQLQAIGILFLLAGINGLPFGDDIEDLIDTIAQMMGYNLHARSKLRDLAIDALGETAGDFIVNGASSLPGSPIDVQARMSLGNLIPGTGILKRSTTDKTRDVAEAVGPIGGMAMSIGQGIGSLMQGDIGTAVMAAAPNAVKNAALGAKIAMTGEYRDQGGRLIAKDVGAMDGVWKAIGFSPSSIAKESREVSGERQRIALARDVEAKIADRWAEAIVEQDADKLSESKMALADWNEKNPDTPIRITLPQIRQRVKAMGMNRRQRLIKSTPKELRGMFQ